MYKIGLDIGYGYVKGYNEATKAILYPSMVSAGHALDGANQISSFISTRKEKNELDRLLVNFKDTENSSDDGLYFVGELAREQGKDADLNLDEYRYNTAKSKILLATAITLLVPENVNEIFLTTGLPYKQAINKDTKRAFKKQLENANYTVSINNGPERNIKYKKVLVFPQALGALYNLMYSLSEEDRSKIFIPTTYVALIDMGYNSTDFLLFYVNNDGSIQPIEQCCDTIMESGMCTVIDRLKLHLQDKFDLKNITTKTAIEVINDRKKYNKNTGMVEDLNEFIENEECRMVENVKTKLQTTWPLEYREQIASLIIAGGSGKDAFKYFNGFITKNQILVSNPQFANAEGFYKFSRYIESQGR